MGDQNSLCNSDRSLRARIASTVDLPAVNPDVVVCVQIQVAVVYGKGAHGRNLPWHRQQGDWSVATAFCLWSFSFIETDDNTAPIELINRFLSSGSVPEVFKSAYITPRMKKTDMDPPDVRSYRPISNLPVVSKLLERLVARQLLAHLKLT